MNIIQVNQVRKQYQNHLALNDVSFDIENLGDGVVSMYIRVLARNRTSRMYTYIQRVNCLKEIGSCDCEAGKSEICEAGMQAGDPGKG